MAKHREKTIDDDALMRALMEITHCMLDPQTRAHITMVEREGVHVTLYEVRETGGVLIIAHESPQPSMQAVRCAYTRHMSRRTLQ